MKLKGEYWGGGCEELLKNEKTLPKEVEFQNIF